MGWLSITNITFGIATAIFYFQLGSVMALQFGAINALISSAYAITWIRHSHFKGYSWCLDCQNAAPDRTVILWISSGVSSQVESCRCCFTHYCQCAWNNCGARIYGIFSGTDCRIFRSSTCRFTDRVHCSCHQRKVLFGKSSGWYRWRRYTDQRKDRGSSDDTRRADNLTYQESKKRVDS